MSTLTVTENWADGTTLTASHLTTAMTSIETVVNGNIDADNLASAAVTAAKLATGAVTSAKIAAGAVETAKLADDAVTAAKIADGAIDAAAKLASSVVETAKIADLAVTTAKINDGAVTQAKRAALGQQVSSSSGTFLTSSGSLTDVTNLSVSITTTGRPVRLELVSAVTTAASGPLDTANSSYLATSGFSNVAFLRGSTVLAVLAPGTYEAPSGFAHIDVPSAGTYTYKVQANAVSGATLVYNCKLVAYEL